MRKIWGAAGLAALALAVSACASSSSSSAATGSTPAAAGSPASAASGATTISVRTIGGQLYELLMGHDRFIADLRPLAFSELRLSSALTCHPYDICTALIAHELGCVVAAPDGRPLQVPLDTTSAVAWTGYANVGLARKIAPKLLSIL